MDLNLEKCPLCGTELSEVKFKEIRAKLSREEQEEAAKLAQAESALRLRLEQQFNQDLEKQRDALQKKAQEEAEARIQTIASERDLAAKKLSEAEARTVEIRKQAEQEIAKEKLAAQLKAKQDATQQIAQTSAERDEFAKKLKEAQQRESEARKQAAQDLEKEIKAAEARAKAEAAEQIKQAGAERDESVRKLVEAQRREAEVRKAAAQDLENEKKAAEAKAKAEAAEQINKLALERNQATARAKEAEAREAATKRQMTEEAERERLSVLANQRQTLETDKKLALLKQQAEFNREREGVQKKMQLLERQLQKKTANELGDGAEIDLFEMLRESFPTDKISRTPKGQAGADMLHEILYKGTPCGRIIVESKNRLDWKSQYATKLRQDQVEAGAEHAILTTTVFPSGKKEMCIESGVIVISPARAVYIAQLLRGAMITMHVKGLSMKERSSKMEMLYKLITSDSYAGKFAEANRLADEILKLDVDEKKTHDNVWKKRGSLAKQVQNVLREAETDVAAVIEGSDGGQSPPAFGVKGAPILSVDSRRQEIV